MGKQITEMLKGTLEGIILAIHPAGLRMATRSRRGCGIRASPTSPKAPSMRCSSDRAAPLVDVEGPFGQGALRKVYSLNAQGQEYLNEFWRTWSLAERLNSQESDHVTNWIETITGSLEQKKQYRRTRPASRPSRAVRQRRKVQRYLCTTAASPRATSSSR